jgi:predicted O-methyltransferase YrrM
MADGLGRVILRKGNPLYEAKMYLRSLNILYGARGLMNHLVYKKMYELVYDLADLDIVEVGAGAGAGSIAIASAIKESGKKSRLIVIEKCEGGSRTRYGDYQTNLKIIKDNFKRYGVDDKTELFPKKLTFENKDEIISLIKTGKIAALIIDADGRIDRDFFLFWPLLETGGIIVMDDYEDSTKISQLSSILNRYTPAGKRKMLMTYRLINQFIEWGLFKISCKVERAVFGYKPENADFNRFDLKVCEKIIKDVEKIP